MMNTSPTIIQYRSGEKRSLFLKTQRERHCSCRDPKASNACTTNELLRAILKKYPKSCHKRQTTPTIGNGGRVVIVYFREMLHFFSKENATIFDLPASRSRRERSWRLRRGERSQRSTSKGQSRALLDLPCMIFRSARGHTLLHTPASLQAGGSEPWHGAELSQVILGKELNLATQSLNTMLWYSHSLDLKLLNKYNEINILPFNLK